MSSHRRHRAKSWHIFLVVLGIKTISVAGSHRLLLSSPRACNSSFPNDVVQYDPRIQAVYGLNGTRMYAGYWVSCSAEPNSTAWACSSCGIACPPGTVFAEAFLNKTCPFSPCCVAIVWTAGTAANVPGFPLALPLMGQAGEQPAVQQAAGMAIIFTESVAATLAAPDPSNLSIAVDRSKTVLDALSPIAALAVTFSPDSKFEYVRQVLQLVYQALAKIAVEMQKMGASIDAVVGLKGYRDLRLTMVQNRDSLMAAMQSPHDKTQSLRYLTSCQSASAASAGSLAASIYESVVRTNSSGSSGLMRTVAKSVGDNASAFLPFAKVILADVALDLALSQACDTALGNYASAASKAKDLPKKFLAIADPLQQFYRSLMPGSPAPAAPAPAPTSVDASPSTSKGVGAPKGRGPKWQRRYTIVGGVFGAIFGVILCIVCAKVCGG